MVVQPGDRYKDHDFLVRTIVDMYEVKDKEGADDVAVDHPALLIPADGSP